MICLENKKNDWSQTSPAPWGGCGQACTPLCILVSWQRPWEKQQELDGGGQHSTDLLGMEGQLGHVEAQRQTYEWETHTGTPVQRQMANAKFQLWLNYWISWAQPRAATPSKHFDSSKCCCHSIHHSIHGRICGLMSLQTRTPLRSKTPIHRAGKMASSPPGFKNSEHFGWSDMSNLSYDAKFYHWNLQK